MINGLKRYSVWWILLSILSAVILGKYTPSLFNKIDFLGDIFLNLLKLFALPLICSALIVSLGNMGKNLSGLKVMSKAILSYMLLSEVIAVAIALVLFNLFSPGSQVDPNLILHGQAYEASSMYSINLANFLVSIVPHNIFADLASFNLLPIVLFSIMFGVACALIGEKSTPVLQFTTSVNDIVSVCLHGVMLFAPIGIFALVGNGVAQSALHGHAADNLMALLYFVCILILGLFLHGLWQFMALIMFTQQHPVTVLRKCITVFSTAFATSSSVATLPAAMEATDSLNSKPKVTRLMLPLCASINVGGMMLYELSAVLFFAQVLDLHIPLSYQLVLGAICILSGMAEGGIPETSMVSLVMVFKTVNIPLTAISVLLPLDRIIDRLRTMVNIFGNICGAVIVSRFIEYEPIPESLGEPHETIQSF